MVWSTFGRRTPPAGPEGCTDLDGRIVTAAGIRFAGLGGSASCNDGPNQFTQAQMRRRALGLEMRSRGRRLRGRCPIDVLVTHAPPLGCGDRDDPAHVGFAPFHRLVRALSARALIHGHIHPHGEAVPDGRLGRADVLNAVGYRILELAP